MKKKYFIPLLLFGITGYTQSFFVESGMNYTKFKYRNSNSIKTIPLHSDFGNTLHFGYQLPVNDNGLQYELGLQFDELNNYVEEPNLAVNYSLNYLGINNSVLYSIIGSGRNSGRIVLNLKGGLLIDKFISGKEYIMGKNYDLKKFNEFNKFFLVATFGIQTKFLVSEAVDISLSYDYCNSFFNSGNGNNQHLSFSSQQYKLGIYFILD